VKGRRKSKRRRIKWEILQYMQEGRNELIEEEAKEKILRKIQ
jgi:hypothetical protein